MVRVGTLAMRGIPVLRTVRRCTAAGGQSVGLRVVGQRRFGVGSRWDSTGGTLEQGEASAGRGLRRARGRTLRLLGQLILLLILLLRLLRLLLLLKVLLLLLLWGVLRVELLAADVGIARLRRLMRSNGRSGWCSERIVRVGHWAAGG